MKMSNILSIKKLDAHYDGMTALQNISIEVNKGEIISILGSNGAGKSTLMKIICGIKEQTTGEISFNGEGINDVPDYKRVELGIVQVPEGRRLFPAMTVEENLIIGSFNKNARAQRKETLEEVYRLLPRLKERRKQEAKTLSGGEQQMVAIGRALMSQPKILLLDEPSLGLSPLLVKSLFSLIQDISKKGITIMLSEQNVMQTLKLVDRSYVLENGHIVLEGKGKDLLNDDHIKKAFLGM
jgi:branched-chain amino acid transport system ATP-binding protein